MSTTTVTATKPQKTRKDRDKERDKERKSSLPQPNERLKTVIRRLPPNLPEDVFWQSVQPWVTEDTAVFKIYYPGKLRKKLNKENIPSRAYVAFKTEEQLALFSREYDGHIFRDKTGVESQAVVEFAPYPKIPTEKKKPDTRNATIEKDEDYISFLESLKASENAEPVSLESLIASSQPPPPPKTTPLLEALKAERSADKDKEAILRNHAHYNQVNNGPSRKEEKKKATSATPPSLPSKPSETTTSNAAANAKKAQKKAQANAATAPSQQNAKNAQHGASASKNAVNGTATANQTPKAAKPARAPRAPAAKPDTSVSVPPTPTDNTPVDAPTPAPRRSRPVIGLASRQFEAALSGVAGLAGAASERKRREKEKEKEKLAAAGEGAAVTAPSVVYARIDNSDPEKPIPPPASPKKEKTRRGTRGGGGAAAASTAPAAMLANGTKVLNILQRSSDGVPPVIIQRNTSATTSTATAVPVPPSSQNVTRGSGRRGRGGGRGRGGPASGAASGSPRAGG